jgi:hypothetical protein
VQYTLKHQSTRSSNGVLSLWSKRV